MIQLTSKEFEQINDICQNYDHPIKEAEKRGWIVSNKKECPMCHYEMDSDRIVCEACEFDERS